MEEEILKFKGIITKEDVFVVDITRCVYFKNIFNHISLLNYTNVIALRLQPNYYYFPALQMGFFDHFLESLEFRAVNILGIEESLLPEEEKTDLKIILNKL